MTIPEISPLLIASVCGLSFICAAALGVIAFLAIRFAGGELFEVIGGFFDREPGKQNMETPLPQPGASRPNLRAKAQSFDFDQAVQQQNPTANPKQFGENRGLNPENRNRFNAKTRDFDLSPKGSLTDNPDVATTPPAPNFSPSSEHIPNSYSNLSGRYTRYRYSKRMDAESQTPSGGLDTPESTPDAGKLRKRPRDEGGHDEVFGGKLDFDGDGDLDT